MKLTLIDLQETQRQVELCAAGIDDAPEIEALGMLFRRNLPLDKYFIMARRFEVNGKKGPWRLIVMEEDGHGNNQLIHDTERHPLPDQELCQWYLDRMVKPA